MRTYADRTWKGLRARVDIEVRPFAAGRGPSIEAGVRRLPVPLRALHLSWRALSWPRAETIVGDVDVVHSLDLLPPPTRRPLVVTVVDVLALSHPQFFSADTRRLQQAHVDGARVADLVVTASTETGNEVTRHGAIPAERIAVVPWGPSNLPVRGEPAGSVAALGFDDYLLSVSVVEPRKGYEVLAEAVNRVPGCPPLIIAGGDGFRGAEIRRRVAEIDRAGLVHFAGNMGPAALADLYDRARLVVQPSLCEGFGIPLLDAMTRGAAIVATDLAQTVEIAAGTVEPVPPGDVDALSDAITRLLGNPVARVDLGRRALARSRVFSWERTTEMLVAAYQRAIGG
jgi:glycosyltransferase involved in cell wall biosynthesis